MISLWVVSSTFKCFPTPPHVKSQTVSSKTFIIRASGQEYPVRVNIIPRDIDDPLVVSAWMLEKACVQQADSFLRVIGKDLDESAASQGNIETQTEVLQR